MKRALTAAALFAFTFPLVVAAAPFAAPRPPTQPTAADNPGGAVYHYTYKRHTVPHVGLGGVEYYVPVPADSQANQGPYPVLVYAHGMEAYGGSFLHGPGPLDFFYTQMMEHIARKGYVVIFPQYEDGLLDSDFTAMAYRIFASMDYVAAHEPKADFTRTVWAAHSMGGIVTAIAAGITGDNPAYASYKPQAIIGTCAYFDLPSIAPYLSKIPASISYIMLTGSSDGTAPTANNLDFYNALPQVSSKEIIELQSAFDEQPQLLANHNLPMTRGSLFGASGHLDALDWYGTWKIIVGTLDQDFNGGSCKWTWGSERLDGGTDSTGRHLTYKLIMAQNPTTCNE